MKLFNTKCHKKGENYSMWMDVRAIETIDLGLKSKFH